MLYKDYLNCKRDYQEFGSQFLLEKKHCCLYYKPGKGKTYPCIDAIREVDKSKDGKAKVLILSTADAIKNMWNAEMVPQNILPKDTVLMSLSSAIQDKTKPKLLKVKWDILVIDECHKIKSNSTKSSKLVHLLARNTEYVWGLSGTPRGNNDVDIFCQFHNMWIADWGEISYTMFVNTCCEVDKKFFNGNCITVPVGINQRYKAGWENNIAMYTQRIGYDDNDNMPPMSVDIVKLAYEFTKEYKLAEQGVIQLSEYETTMTKLAAIQKLQQIANGFMYIPKDESREVYHIQDNKKLEWLKNNISENIVIVYRYEQDYNDIKSLLDNINFTSTELVEEFKSGKSQILLLQCSRCESFNLQMCNKIIFYTLDYSYIKYNQMIHRVWRMGQSKSVEIVILLQKNTVEENIWRAIQNKQKLSELFMSIKGV